MLVGIVVFGTVKLINDTRASKAKPS